MKEQQEAGPLLNRVRGEDGQCNRKWRIYSRLQLPTHIYSQTGFPSSTLHFDNHPSLVVMSQETECMSLLT